MKSVVVEASTVAKAIETAWIKADKPEEFFIRVLQEHQLGFLGFGSQKAKVVFFFKNSQKSDSLFPVVLKQKEYTNLFDNHHLKIPAELNFVDTELNKNIILGGTHKKKSSHQNQQQKNKKNIKEDNSLVRSDNNIDKENKFHKVKQIEQEIVDKVALTHQDNSHRSQIKVDNKSIISQKHKAINSQKNKTNIENLPGKKNHQNSAHASNIKKILVAENIKSSDQKSISQDTFKKSVHKTDYPKALDSVDKKDDVVKDIARALKKVQSQKIVANVSRQTSEKIEGLKIQSTDIADQVVQGKEINKHTEQKPVAEKVVIKFKRRPLVFDENTVSGITSNIAKSTSGNEKD